jgi:hypothetical protein
MPSVRLLRSHGRSLGGGSEGAEQFGLRVDIGWLGCVKVEHQNRRRNSENAIAERRDSADLLAGYSVVVGPHDVTKPFGLKWVNPSGGLERVIAKRGLT